MQCNGKHPLCCPPCRLKRCPSPTAWAPYCGRGLPIFSRRKRRKQLALSRVPGKTAYARHTIRHKYLVMAQHLADKAATQT